MKRLFIVLAIVLIVVAIVTPAIACTNHNVVNPKEYKTIQVGWTKHEIHTYLEQSGNQTYHWTDPNNGEFIQKVYKGKRVPAIDGHSGMTDSRMVVDYNYNGHNWVNRYMTWCVWNDFAWDCSKVKTDLS